MPSGTWQLRDDGTFGGTDELYVGHRANTTEQAEIITTGMGSQLIVKLNALQGGGNDAFTLQNNIDAFKAAYITPLGITVVAATSSDDNQLWIDFELIRDTDAFLVKFNDITTLGKILNIARILRAIWNGERDNTNITRACLKALDPLRDTAGVEPWPQAVTADPPYGDDSISGIVAGGFVPAVGDPTGGEVGNIVLENGTIVIPDKLIVRFEPLSHNGVYESALGFYRILSDKLRTTLNINITSLTWLEVGETMPGGGGGVGDHYWIRMALNDDPVLARMAFLIVENIRDGIFDYYRALKNAIFRDICD